MTNATTSTSDLSDPLEVKQRLREVWTSGDFGKIARSFSEGAAKFVAAMPIGPGIRVLDVACGTGNQSIPAAAMGANVIGVDIAPDAIRQARASAFAKRLNVRFDHGDAEDLPYPNASFDVVISMFGAMFAPFPHRVSSELFRVCRPGGLVIMANWSPSGFVGDFFRAVASFVPPPPSLPSPLLWGDEDTIRQRLSRYSSEITCEERSMRLSFPFSPSETVEYWRKYYGPANQAFASLSCRYQPQLRRELDQLFERYNRAREGSTQIEAQYVTVTALRIK